MVKIEDEISEMDSMEMDEHDEDGADSMEPADIFSDKSNDSKLSAAQSGLAEEDDVLLDDIENILDLEEEKYPRFTLAKNKARFLRMVSGYRQKEDWIQVAPLSGVTKLFKHQTKELESIRSSKLDYEMELETGTLTPSQRSYKRDELKMCRVHEKMAVHLISKLQLKIKSGRR